MQLQYSEGVFTPDHGQAQSFQAGLGSPYRRIESEI
jgi:hypothetical protein